MTRGKQPTSIRSDVGDTWFICFESEDDAVATMMAINKKQITFEVHARLEQERARNSMTVVSAFVIQGKAIKARLKNADNVRACMGAGPNAGGAGSGGPGPDRRINSSPKGYERSKWYRACFVVLILFSLCIGIRCSR